MGSGSTGPGARGDGEGDLEALLARAVERGVIDRDQAAALLSLREPPPAPPPPPSVVDEARAARQARRREEEAALEAKVRALREEQERNARAERELRERRAQEKARQIGARAALSASGGSDDDWLRIVGQAEDEEAGFRRDVLPLIYENVGWLVGTLLVLAGSVYGLREAWITFDAAGRWASVAAALFIYHALFVIVGAVLARRSALAGQFLSGIGACLMPVAYVAVANLAAQNRLLGVIGTVVLSAAGVATLAGVGRRFDVGRGLVPAMLLPALTMVVYPHLESASPLRMALPFVALGGPWLITMREATRRSLGVLALVLYAAIASEIFALSSDAADPVTVAGPVWRVAGPVFGSWLGSYVAALGLCLFAARRMQPSNQMKRRVLAVAVWLGFALTAGAGALSLITALLAGAPPRVELLIALAAGLAACAQARWLASRRREAFHAVLLLASLACAVACRLILPGDGARLWWALAAFLPAALHLGGVHLAPAPARGGEAAAALGAIVVALIWSFEPARAGLYPVTLLVTLALALGCHRQAAGDAAGSVWHHVAAVVATLGLALGIWSVPNPGLLGFAYVGLATVYAIAAIATRTGRDEGRSSPLDDISLLLFAVAAFASLRALTPSPAFVWSPVAGLRLEPSIVVGAAPLSAASLGLLLRSLRDRSAVPSAAGAIGLATAAIAIASPRTVGAATLVLGLATLAAGSIAALLTRRARPAAVGRRVLTVASGGIELPWAWSGEGAIGQGFGVVMLPLAVLAALCNLGWLSARGEDRTLALAGGVALALACLVVFATQAGAIFRLRGRVAVLWALVAPVALTAITNRIGRPISPTEVGLKTTLVGVGLWLASLGFARVGPWLEDKLGAPTGEGDRYPRVPQTGVVALAALLVVKALLMHTVPLYRGLSVVPPTMLLGPALLLFLMRRSLGASLVFWLCVPLVAVGGALIGAERQLLGPSLMQLGGPDGPWVPAAARASLTEGWLSVARYGGWEAVAALYRGALIGLAAAGGAYAAIALAARRRPELADSSAAAAALIAGFVCALGFWVSSMAAAAIALAAGVVLARRRPSLAAWVRLGAATALAVHAFAQAQPAVLAWPQVVLGAAALAVAACAHLTLERSTRRAAQIWLGQAAAWALALGALAYGLAHGRLNAELIEGWAVMANAVRGLASWGSTPVPALAFLFAGAAILVGAVSWNAIARRTETLVQLLVGTTLVVLAASTWALPAAGVAGIESLVIIGALAMAAALPLAGLGTRRGERLQELARASRVARDAIMVIAAAFVALVVMTVRAPAWPFTTGAAMAILAAISGLSLLALIAERRPLHLYFLGTAVVGGYGLGRAIGLVNATPANDAVLLLVLDFTMVGVTVFLRRRALDELATATRRFAATLPIVMALVLPWQATGQSVLLALGAGAFYGLLGWIERNRLLGTLGAIAANIAVLALLLSQGLRGFEMVLAPIGLCTLIIVHLFADGMAAEVRGALRFIGTGLTYAPAAIALVLQVGSAQSDYYSLGFAAACIVGLAAGVWLRVRAYLILGFAFLVLDLGTELVRAGLRNQRLGFFALSLSGLAILAGMAAYTLQREKFQQRFGRLRRALATWD